MEPPMPPSGHGVRFCTASDGVRLAWTAIGKGPPVVRAAYWLTHIEHDDHSIIWGPWLREFAQRVTLVRYDQRGCGLSDREVGDISFDAWLGDLEAVVDAARLQRFTLLGMSQGASIAVAYAVRHPERVERLLIYGGFAQGRRCRGSREQVKEAELQERAIALGWGRENPAFRQIFTSQFMANATTEELAAWDEMQRLSCSAETAVHRYPGRDYDLVTFFDCLHDMGDPVGAATHVRRSQKPDGTWMIVEPFANDTLKDNINPVGCIYYSASTLLCKPCSRSQEVGLCLGAQAGEKRLRGVVSDGGFTRFRRATETPFNLVLEARP
jgi:pimeloyl-ACP methyl ester carboxylesterase